jgi:hypothetical protein
VRWFTAGAGTPIVILFCAVGPVSIIAKPGSYVDKLYQLCHDEVKKSPGEIAAVLIRQKIPKKQKKPIVTEVRKGFGKDI